MTNNQTSSSTIYIRTNGRGNAWPVPLGKEHPFYNKNNFEDLANASFSIIRYDADKQIEKELLIDAGHGTIQHLIKSSNRIPEAIFLTHPHIDHTLSIDWVVQSYWRQFHKRYPIYASPLCWEQTLATFPQLKNMVNFKALQPGKAVKVDEFDEMEITFLPVFHGESAVGAGILLFEHKKNANTHKALFTGDSLIPLLRKSDIEHLQNCDVVFTDANNRYPYPNSNHWSVCRPELIGEPESDLLKGWLQSKGSKINWLIRPNLPVKFNKTAHAYFDTFLRESYSGNKLILSVFDLAKAINPQNIHLVHYSGSEDNKHYGKEILNTEELQTWANKKASQAMLNTRFIVPRTNDLFNWINI
jgi:glyoxylase-like metal-dependent hydrolase (beta-lactamase superfamily II)